MGSGALSRKDICQNMKLFSSIFSVKRALGNAPVQGELPEDKDILRQTLKIAWPASVESFLVALCAFVDQRMVSFISPSAIAAVGITSEPRMLALAFFTGLGIGVSAIVARRKGEGDRAKANFVLRAGLVIALIATVLLSVFGVLFADEIMRFAGSNADSHQGAVEYFTIVIGCLAFNSFSLIINAAQRGAGNTKLAMKANLTCNAVNLAADWLLIPVYGVKGAAWGLVLGTAVGFVISAASLFSKNSYLRFTENAHVDDRAAALRPLWNIGRNTVVEQLILRAGFFLFAKTLAGLGTMAFTAHRIGMNVLNISFSFGDGLAAASVALVGAALGQKRRDLARVYGTFCQRIGLLVACALACSYVLFGRGIVSLLSRDADVINTARNLLYIMTVLIMLQITQLVYSGCLRGCGDTKFCTRLSLLSFGVLRPGLAWIAVQLLDLGIYGAWACLIIDQIVRVVVTYRRFYGEKWAKIEV